MIIITKTTAAAGKIVKIKETPQSDIQTASARVNRTATLSGGVVIDHLGYVVGDRTMKISAKLSETDAALLWTFFTTETLLNLASEEGYFIGAISQMKKRGGNIQFTFLVKE